MPSPKPRGRRTLLLILAICAAPVIASYCAYYFFRPDGRTNYGDLVEPQRPTPALTLHHLDGRVMPPAELKGKWLMVMVSGGDCPQACQDKLYHLRQVRLTTGKDRDRVERVWLIPDAAPLPTLLMREYDGTWMLRADPAQLGAWLPAESPATIADHIYLVDPLGNLMLRWPRDADPNQTKKDLAKVLKASHIG